jgi:uncharacterized protein
VDDRAALSVSEPEIDTMTAAGATPLPAASTRRHFHVLAKPTGAICNLDCKYCFFLSKEMLYPGNRFRMADDLLAIYLRQLLESQAGPSATVAWQGGEPTLMGLDFFRRAIEHVRTFAPPGVTIEHTIQTNGVELTPDWCEFFREHRFLVGLSLDGPRRMHDRYRVDKGGRPTFDKVMRAARLLQQHRVEFNVLTTVHAGNEAHPLEVYHFLRDEVGTRFIQFIPIVERVTSQLLPLANRGWGERGSEPRPLYRQEGSLVTDRSVAPDQWGRFLIAIFDEWVRRDVGRVFVQMFDAALASWVGAPAGMCIFAETCGSAVALEHNGDLYSCDHFVEPMHLLGNIRKVHMLELVSSDQQRRFGNDKRDSLPRYCRLCTVRFACNGECPKNRFLTTPDGEAGLNYLCAGYKAFFTHIDRPMRLMAELLGRGRYAEEVMPLLAAEAAPPQERLASTSRSDPCACGSGRTYKHCHGRSAVAAEGGISPLRTSQQG